MEYNPVPFYHTYILYDPNDLVSTACVQFSLFPIYVMVFYTSWFLVTREIQPVITVGGHLVGEVLNVIIKRAVQQPRPDFHRHFGEGSLVLGHGMPSAHSQFMGFFAAYYMCVVILQIPVTKVHKAGTGMFLVVSGVCVAFSRVYLQYHTTPQVVVGLAVGVVWGLFYFVVLLLARDVGLVDWVLLWRVVAFFSVKDSYYHCYRLFEEEARQVDECRVAKKRGLVCKPHQE
ncbi:dolichyl pyrophosphate phosphatase [Metschnikowia bicuspidata var. bicuspidata NRRL YB-4993]|uniref:Dolichyldiphosphatase n=1 Tax=Metschnikowia bicuspidata var. bicuspidata NRRL YB-4993 TaxID=869754 RepID=A0A1A0H8B6_9ASCO|nr:dolichyl pyrophosphate phosphatase [Metschnikowia bicuspidata var. bicuspidata NRRL YB-4993]OBA20354.1 dolichyl pyrophosphate phosphatase [Metschnikowia bicuspidata var. bicuspidata NRRL YB-4993]